MRCAVSLCCLIVIAGCGGESYEIAPASGSVTMDGEPLANVTLNFQPVNVGDTPNPGPGSYAKTDDKGQFTLATINDNTSGAVVGKHTVTVTTPDTTDPESENADINEFVDPIPARYNAESQLTEEIPSGGTDAIKLELTSEKDDLDQVGTSY